MKTFTTIGACAALAALALGCGGSGPSESEFVEACTKTQATHGECACAAHEARNSLSTEHYTMMVLDMQGKRQELEKMAEKMSFEQRAAFAQEQMAVIGKCANAK